MIKFSDHKKWGQLSYLDYLEANNIPFMYDGKELSFETNSDEVRARSIWNCLTGSEQIGVYA